MTSDLCVFPRPYLADSFFTTPGADTIGAAPAKPVLALTSLENVRGMPETVASTGAEFLKSS